eukprot:4162890-Prymnesium_polylepis.1
MKKPSTSAASSATAPPTIAAIVPIEIEAFPVESATATLGSDGGDCGGDNGGGDGAGMTTAKDRKTTGGVAVMAMPRASEAFFGSPNAAFRSPITTCAACTVGKLTTASMRTLAATTVTLTQAVLTLASRAMLLSETSPAATRLTCASNTTCVVVPGAVGDGITAEGGVSGSQSEGHTTGGGDDGNRGQAGGADGRGLLGGSNEGEGCEGDGAEGGVEGSGRDKDGDGGNGGSGCEGGSGEGGGGDGGSSEGGSGEGGG